MLVVLDTGPLGMVTNPRASAQTRRCAEWLTVLLHRGVDVRVAEIADYEVRRELLRANKAEGITRLDELKRSLGYSAITTEVMLKAAEFWARARNIGRQAADDRALDGDMILAAQAALAKSRTAR